MWQSGIVAFLPCKRPLVERWRFMPVFAIGFLNPTIAFPAGDDVAQSRLTTIATLQSSEVIHRERRSQLVEHRVIGSVALALVAGIDVLILQSLAEGLDLLAQASLPSLPNHLSQL